MKHSMSKIMHEAAFAYMGLEHTYGLFDVTPEELPLFMENAYFLGLNVTIPLKVAIMEYVDELATEAKLIGSVNTLRYDRIKEGFRTVGFNTDVLGLMKCLMEAEVDVLDETFLVLGAGGAGRGIVYKLAMEKARVYNFDVDENKSANLAQEVLHKLDVRVEAVNLEGIKEIIKNVDVLVNATPVGMHPNVDKSPVPSEILHPGLTVVDIVYNPVETKLIRQAQKKDCKTVSGVGMLVHQGAEAQRIWLKNDPPIDVMRAAVLTELEKHV